MLKVYNSLTRTLEEFRPLKDNEVTMYTCGPTVYNYPTIGNWRTYIFSDVVNRSLRYLGYNVKFVMNLTDVGHLTGDNLGDASSGEDRLEKAAKKENKTAWDIAKFYSDDFVNGVNKLNILNPLIFCKATEHIDEQIDLVKKIEERGYTYKISDGIYFDVKKYESSGNTYGELSNLDQILEGARVEVNPEKKDPRDFALWKFSPKDSKRDMEWDSPWGMGFPGWHIECSAMGMKYLGEQIDLHLGGEDLRSTHHPNEIAQSEAATNNKPFVRYWMHGAFLQVDGGRMGKSLGNAYVLKDIEDKGINLLALRYFYFTSHYSSKLNFTWDALKSSEITLNKLINAVKRLSSEVESLNTIDLNINLDYQSRFIQYLENDFDMPKVLSLIWELLKSNVSASDKLATVLDFDKVLGFNLSNILDQPSSIDLSDDVKTLLLERDVARKKKDFSESDRIRDILLNKYNIKVYDTDNGQEIEEV